MLKSAFTLLELVFVIVVVGIISIVLIPNFNKNNSGEAAYQIAEHLRLAQHLAMAEDFTGQSATWQARLWRMRFTNSPQGFCYTVFANRDENRNADRIESAIDPLTKLRVYSDAGCNQNQADTPDALLWRRFGVRAVNLNGCGRNAHIAFDNLGRAGQVQGTIFIPLINNCIINITTDNDENATVVVVPETGYVDVIQINGITLP